ncbi:putative ferredoxin [Streptomyces sp. Tu6071]|nr:putative ferredoxin [Streptomyces sp. Tu6071]
MRVHGRDRKCAGAPGKRGRARGARGSPVLRRKGGDEGVVALDQAQLAGPAGRAQLVEELDVRLVVVLPLLGGVVLVEDRLDRADRLAGTAVDALIRVDVEGTLPLVDAVDRALLDASLVLDVDTRLRDDVGHAVVPPR